MSRWKKFQRGIDPGHENLQAIADSSELEESLSEED
jgi:hypothetical protein